MLGCFFCETLAIPTILIICKIWGLTSLVKAVLSGLSGNSSCCHRSSFIRRVASVINRSGVFAKKRGSYQAVLFIKVGHHWASLASLSGQLQVDGDPLGRGDDWGLVDVLSQGRHHRHK